MFKDFSLSFLDELEVFIITPDADESRNNNEILKSPTKNRLKHWKRK